MKTIIYLFTFFLLTQNTYAADIFLIKIDGNHQTQISVEDNKISLTRTPIPKAPTANYVISGASPYDDRERLNLSGSVEEVSPGVFHLFQAVLTTKGYSWDGAISEKSDQIEKFNFSDESLVIQFNQENRTAKVSTSLSRDDQRDLSQTYRKIIGDYSWDTLAEDQSIECTDGC